MNQDLIYKSHATYLRYTLRPEILKEIADKAAQTINEKFPDAEYIVAMGISGLSILPAVSYLTGKKMIILRKDNDLNNHSYIGFNSEDADSHRKAEYYPTESNNISAVAIDDLISSGTTMEIIYDRLKNMGILLEGIILYYDSKSENFEIDGLDIPVISVGYWNQY